MRNRAYQEVSPVCCIKKTIYQVSGSKTCGDKQDPVRI